MARNPIVGEVRRVREEQAAKHDFDIKAILAAAKKRQRCSGHLVVSFAKAQAPRPVEEKHTDRNLLVESGRSTVSVPRRPKKLARPQR